MIQRLNLLPCSISGAEETELVHTESLPVTGSPLALGKGLPKACQVQHGLASLFWGCSSWRN